MDIQVQLEIAHYAKWVVIITSGVALVIWVALRLRRPGSIARDVMNARAWHERSRR